MEYKKVNLKNLDKLFYDWDGNLYYKDTFLTKDWKFWPAIDFDLEDIRLAIKNGIEFIWIQGDSIEPFDMEELEKWTVQK